MKTQTLRIRRESDEVTLVCQIRQELARINARNVLLEQGMLMGCRRYFGGQMVGRRRCFVDGAGNWSRIWKEILYCSYVTIHSRTNQSASTRNERNSNHAF